MAWGLGRGMGGYMVHFGPLTNLLLVSFPTTTLPHTTTSPLCYNQLRSNTLLQHYSDGTNLNLGLYYHHAITTPPTTTTTPLFSFAIMKWDCGNHSQPGQRELWTNCPLGWEKRCAKWTFLSHITLVEKSAQNGQWIHTNIAHIFATIPYFTYGSKNRQQSRTTPHHQHNPPTATPLPQRPTLPCAALHLLFSLHISQHINYQSQLTSYYTVFVTIFFLREWTPTIINNYHHYHQ